LHAHLQSAAELARRLGLTLHTHLAETMEEEAYCMELYGATPVEYLTDLGWLGADVWCAHCVHLSADDTADFAASGTGVAHCPTSIHRCRRAPVGRIPTQASVWVSASTARRRTSGATSCE
jgi:cytosine/adenosine deaminase-related metal-dependent hydrolase